MSPVKYQEIFQEIVAPGVVCETTVSGVIADDERKVFGLLSDPPQERLILVDVEGTGKVTQAVVDTDHTQVTTDFHLTTCDGASYQTTSQRLHLTYLAPSQPKSHRRDPVIIDETDLRRYGLKI